MCIHVVINGESQFSTDPTFFELFSSSSPMLIYRQTDIVFILPEPMSKRKNTIESMIQKSKTKVKKKRFQDLIFQV